MGNESTIMVELVVDDNGTIKIKEFSRAADQAFGQVEGKARSAGSAISALPVPIGKVGAALKPLAGLVTGAFSVAAITEFSRSVVQAASDMQETSSKFNVVFSAQRTMAGGWTEELHNDYVMSTQAAKDYLATMMDLLGPMGMASDKAAGLSFEITKLGADLASFNNEDQIDVMENLRSALVGEYEAVRKYGIILSDTIVTNQALNMGLAKTKDALTAADKAQAAFNLMLQMSPNARGDVARTMDEYANATRRVQANMDDLKVTLGRDVLPLLGQMKSELADFIQLVDDKLNPHSVGSLQRRYDSLTEQLQQGQTSQYKTAGTIGKASSWLPGPVGMLRLPIASAQKTIDLLGITGKSDIEAERDRVYWELRKAQRMKAHDQDQQAPAEETASPFAPPPSKGTKSTKSTSAAEKNEYQADLEAYNRQRLAIQEQAEQDLEASTLSHFDLQRAQARREYGHQLDDLVEGLEQKGYSWQQYADTSLAANDAFNAKMAAINEAERAENEKQDLESWQRLNATAEEQSGYLVTLSERTANAMEQNFSDLFFDAFTGKLDSLSDYAEAVFTSIARASSDVMGQMMKEMIFGTGKAGATGALGGLGDFFDVLFGGMSIGLAGGGTITEPIWGIGKSGRRYRLGENAPGEVEDVIPRSKRGGGGSVVQNQISLTIQAVDAASFTELAGRNPQAIIGPLIEELAGGNRGLRSAIRGSL